MDYDYSAIQRQILKQAIAENVANKIDHIDLDLNSIVNSKAIAVLDDIRNVLLNETNDLIIAGKIRKIFDFHNISHEKSQREKIYDTLLQKNS